MNQPESFEEPEKAPSLEKERAELQIWLEWFRSLVTLGGALTRLANAEAKVAMGDVGRLAGLVLVVLPLVCFAWLGLSILLAWLLYLASESVTVGLVTFLAIQVASLLAIKAMANRFKRSLGMPHTREQLRAIIRDFENGPQSTDQAPPAK